MTWKPTKELRFVLRKIDGNPTRILQQLWEEKWTSFGDKFTRSEWRDVPLVESSDDR